jgi:ABC-2 type transport system ATP-binding protein
MEPALELRHVTKDYAVGLRGVRLRALDGVSFKVAAGEVCGLLGPNGSGKSTAMKLFAGLQRATSGSCLIKGRSSRDAVVEGLIGYMPESPSSPSFMTVTEVVRYHAKLSGLTFDAVETRAAWVLEITGLQSMAGRKACALSKGVTQRLGLAQALVHDPEILLLDEPTAGVDPMGVAGILALIPALKRAGKSILLSSHLLDQVAAVCDRVVVLGAGQKLFAGTMDELPGARRLFSTEPMAEPLQSELIAWLATRGHTLADVGWHRPSLDEFYCERMGKREQQESET